MSKMMHTHGKLRADGKYNHHCGGCGIRFIGQTDLVTHNCGPKTKRTYCQFLGEDTEAKVKVECNCKGKTSRMLPLHHCEVFGRCLPSPLRPREVKKWIKRDESKLIAVCSMCPLA